MKKTLIIIGGIFSALLVVLFTSIVLASSLSSKTVVCKSSEGSITIMYNDEAIIDYLAKGLSYDFDKEKLSADKMGIDKYIKKFTKNFEDKYSGSCKIK